MCKRRGEKVKLLAGRELVWLVDVCHTELGGRKGGAVGCSGKMRGSGGLKVLRVYKRGSGCAASLLYSHSGSHVFRKANSQRLSDWRHQRWCKGNRFLLRC